MTGTGVPPGDRSRRAVLAAAGAAAAWFALPSLGGCAPFRKRSTTIPMPTVTDLLPLPPRGRTLVVLMPGAYSTAEDFVTYGFFEDVRRRALPIDLIAVDAHRGYFDEGSLLERLRADVVRPARERGYARIWLVGISLGGLGAMLYETTLQDERDARREADARADAPDAPDTHDAWRDRIDGIVAIAPYVGTRPVLDEVRDAGGLASWHRQATDPRDWERRLLSWLQRRQYGPPPEHPKGPKPPQQSQPPDEARQTSSNARHPAPPDDVPLIVAWGAQDRFADGIALVTAGLPAARRLVLPGRHDWPVWRALWQAVLDRFGATIDAAAATAAPAIATAATTTTAVTAAMTTATATATATAAAATAAAAAAAAGGR
ncbi:MAG: hypothetical protein QM766_03425 [Burkholderiaceae bacterium]